MRCTLAELDGRVFDIVVIGGGINGTATANRLASAGYDVLLAEAADFGSGSSSRSSRIMHCGLNYLALAADAPTIALKFHNLVLAAQMMRERRRLRSVMGHRISPHTFYIPIRAGTPVAPWKYDLAMQMLNALGGWDGTLGYRRYPPNCLSEVAVTPWFGEDLVGLVCFTEYVFNWPERICLDLALEAAANGASIRNYTRLTRAESRCGRWRVTLSDAHNESDQATVETRLLLNLAGASSDRIYALCGLSGLRTVTPNKGCHIAVRLPEEFRGVGIINRNELGHLFLCVPWKDFHILGPTETPVEGDEADRPVATDADVALILDEANRTLPRLGLTPRHVLFCWAGLRPNTYEPGNPRGTWLRRIYEHRTSDGALIASISWGRLADHSFTASDLLAIARRHLGTPRQTGARTESAFKADTPRSVEDILFRRTGDGWSADLGLARAADAARELESGSRGAEALLEEYRRTLSESFGYSD